MRSVLRPELYFNEFVRFFFILLCQDDIKVDMSMKIIFCPQL